MCSQKIDGLSFCFRLATHGILITAVTLYFMKGLLMTIIQSVFKYILNPTIWSRVATDIHSTQMPGSVSPQRVQSIGETDIRDENLGKVLDLANQQMQFILKREQIESGQPTKVEPSGVEVLPLKAAESEKSLSDVSSTMSSEQKGETAFAHVSHITCSSQSTSAAQRVSSDGSMESYDDFIDIEIVKSPNASTLSTAHNVTMSSDGSSSLNLSNQSGSTSMTTDDTKTSTDSMDIFSISSDTTSSS